MLRVLEDLGVGALGDAGGGDRAELGTGTYINFQGSATDADVAAAYPPATYARLAAVKRAYDPGNLFALNHNIEPGSAEIADGPAA